ncbi:MAG: hypothetical protein WCB15_06005 [Desulfobacterales bacterium]|jgi:hypothetical protein
MKCPVCGCEYFHTLEELWVEKLLPFGDKGYDKTLQWTLNRRH